MRHQYKAGDVTVFYEDNKDFAERGGGVWHPQGPHISFDAWPSVYFSIPPAKLIRALRHFGLLTESADTKGDA